MDLVLLVGWICVWGVALWGAELAHWALVTWNPTGIGEAENDEGV